MRSAVAYLAARSAGFATRSRRPPRDRGRRGDACRMIALLATAAGTFSVDLESEEIAPAEPFEPDAGTPA